MKPKPLFGTYYPPAFFLASGNAMCVKGYIV